jgi:hypothetical protein
MSEIAKTILAQLGGNRFIAMTGAKNFTGYPDALMFSLPGAGGFTKNGINIVKITLTPADTYTMEFTRRRGSKFTTINVTEDVYWEDLTEIFRQVTGLETRVPHIVGA